MTLTVDDETPVAPPGPPPARLGPLAWVLAGIAALAVFALATVAVVALRSDNGVAAHMKAMANGGMGSMMSGDTSTMPGMSGSGMGSMMGGSGKSSAAIAGAPRLTVVATSFTFTPKEIHVRAGDAVNIRLIATDVTHDLTIDELNFKVTAEPGKPAIGGLRAPTDAGRYTFYCSVAGHRSAGMVGTLVVDAAD